MDKIVIGTLYAHKNHCHPTSDVIATCGHSVGHTWEFDVSTKEIDEGCNCVAYQGLCWRCFLRCLRYGEILFSKAAERIWMNADSQDRKDKR